MRHDSEIKIIYLEGLRGVAALLVLFSHIRNTFYIDFTDDLLVLLKNWTGSFYVSHVVHSIVSLFFDGNLAVYIFWIMSAYVISVKLFKPNADLYLIRSFVKRYFRLAIPVLFSVVFAWILMVLSLMGNISLATKLGKGYIDGWLGRYYTFDPSLFVAIKSSLWNTFFSPNSEVSYNPSLWTMNPELYGSYIIFFCLESLRALGLGMQFTLF